MTAAALSVRRTRVVREDPKKENILYLGTEFGLFVSVDGGAIWHKHTGLPTVPVHDLVMHPRERELVIGTHGRAIYIMDAAPLQDFSTAMLRQLIYLLDVKPAVAQRMLSFQRPLGKTYVGHGGSLRLALCYCSNSTLGSPASPTTTGRNRAGSCPGLRLSTHTLASGCSVKKKPLPWPRWPYWTAFVSRLDRIRAT